ARSPPLLGWYATPIPRSRQRNSKAAIKRSFDETDQRRHTADRPSRLAGVAQLLARDAQRGTASFATRLPLLRVCRATRAAAKSGRGGARSRVFGAECDGAAQTGGDCAVSAR